ncbi:tRNA-splicing endonuclease subunit Sen54 [Bombina bombina]|uniref:tRNA-splicing endonuclease subunit Sen54 n=1 Tax=Bombina bombina TaxID=8345 RepID=UPI00235B25AB|nr:tRNA-splicing endonuclease subunit Sen54 [Bombina bombina]
MLSPAELFAVRNRDQSLPQRSHGQKDFVADGSEVQTNKLQVCRAEQWELLGEERVERLGSLIKGVWKPKEGLVELTSPAGKFWQTMGFTEEGRQCLLPEEAVYLVECGTIQLLYRDLPLSVQEAYERLLTQGSVSVLQYRVYSHLKRLGYIVTRFNPSSIPSLYERRLKLECNDRPDRKRKRSSSPRSKNKRHSENEANHQTMLKSSEQSGIKYSKSNAGSDDQDGKIGCQSEGRTKNRQYCDDKLKHRVVDMEKESRHLHLEGLSSEHQDIPDSSLKEKFSRTSRWDFTKISLPNCSPKFPFTLLHDPEPELLPENVISRKADVSLWLNRLNLRPEKFSRREREQLNWERRYKSSVNSDPKVQKCGSWKEYKQLLQERKHQRERVKPSHLWANSVTPILSPGRSHSTASVLEKITVTSPSLLLDDAERLQRHEPDTPQIHFNVYQADGNAEFRKSKPGTPYVRICVRSFDENIPRLRTIKILAYQSGEVPVVFALVEPGELAFYSFKDFQLPVDVYP